MNSIVSNFLASHNFVTHVDVLSVAQAMLNDMDKGLKGQKSDMDMIRTFCNPPKEPAKNKSVIVIDAGGTNFRSCLVTFDANGVPSISEMEKTCMPGVEKELSKKDFFEQMANNLEHLKNKADRIGFCFSYPMQIQENGDGVLLGFSKEVKAPEVIGSKVGECLVAALKEHGWNSIKRITLCNDTAAALLAGAACAEPGMEYSSYIGMILGTGHNAAYIQPDSDVYKIKEQIIVNESGKFRGVVRSDFDKEVDSHSVQPGSFYTEKLCSGAYLGPVAFYALKAAGDDEILSANVNKALKALDSLSNIELNQFLHAPFSTENKLGKLMKDAKASEDDYNMLYQILDAIVERSARYTSAILTACTIQTGAGKNAARPVCLFCDGSTFFKDWKLKDRVCGYLDEVLTNQLGLYYHVTTCDNDITLGAAISGLID